MPSVTNRKSTEPSAKVGTDPRNGTLKTSIPAATIGSGPDHVEGASRPQSIPPPTKPATLSELPAVICTFVPPLLRQYRLLSALLAKRALA